MECWQSLCQRSAARDVAAANRKKRPRRVYIAATLGPRPAQLVRDLIAGDLRFFEPLEELPAATGRSDPQGDHNYNANQALAGAIAAGARGAYWDILRRLRSA